MKTIYTVNEAGTVVSERLEMADYEMKDGEIDSLKPYTMFDYNFTGPDKPAPPSAEMQAINALGLQVATLMADKAANTTGGAN